MQRKLRCYEITYSIYGHDYKVTKHATSREEAKAAFKEDMRAHHKEYAFVALRWLKHVN